MPKNVVELIALLDLERISATHFVGRDDNREGRILQRVFGGQVLAQSLIAAYQTVEKDRIAHSFSAHFLRAGRTGVPIDYHVEIARDGGSFSTRRVTAVQEGREIFSMVGSFHEPEPGLTHSDLPPIGVPAPEDCPALSDVLAARSHREVAAWHREWGVLEVRFASDTTALTAVGRTDADMKVWVRAASALPDDQRIHQAVLAYASDLTLLAVSTVPHPVDFGGPDMQMASIDHSMWFHRPARADQWLLFDQVSPSASTGLGFSFGRMFSQSTLAASCAQEGLIRLVKPQ